MSSIIVTEGNLVADPHLRLTANGTPVASATLAVTDQLDRRIAMRLFGYSPACGADGQSPPPGAAGRVARFHLVGDDQGRGPWLSRRVSVIRRRFVHEVNADRRLCRPRDCADLAPDRLWRKGIAEV